MVQSDVWAATVIFAEGRKENYFKVLKGETLFGALYGTYTVMLSELSAILKTKKDYQRHRKPASEKSETERRTPKRRYHAL